MGELVGAPAGDLMFGSMAEAFADVVSKFGPETALMSQTGTTMTFTEMDEMSSKLARNISRFLTRDDPSSDDMGPVMIAMSPSVERVVAVLALWKINSHYIPIEAGVPKNRIKLILREVKPRLVLTCEKLRHKFAGADVYAEGLNCVLNYEEMLETNPDENESLRNARSGDRACILYTSGSTGKPKGVVLTHSNLLHRLQWQWRQFPLTKNDVGIAKTSFLFVDSITEVWFFVLKGRPIVVMDEGLRDTDTLVKTIVDYQVSRILLVPSLLQAVLAYAKMTSLRLQNLKYVISSGEPLPLQVAKDFFQIFDDAVLMNFYGSTEFTGDATFAVFRNIEDLNAHELDGCPSIGRPLDGVTVNLIDDNGRIVDADQIGQITVEGPTVMEGYVGIDRSSDEFHTGDYGKIHDGELYYKGRKDDQINIRGHRIHCNDVRETIRDEIDGEVVVMVINPETVRAEIVAFVEGDQIVADEVMKACVSALPDYMHPKVVPIDRIPLTSTGKVDRESLKHIYNKSLGASDKNCAAVQSDDVVRFLTIVAEELELTVDRLSLEQEFCSLGGNSINKVRLVSSLSEKGYSSNYKNFILAKTLGEMYEIVQETAATRTTTTLEEEEYKIVQTDDSSPHAEIASLLLDAFLAKDPMVSLSLSREDAAERRESNRMMTHFYNIGLESDGVFMIKDTESDKMVGAIIVMDSAKFRMPEDMAIPDGWELILEILGHADSLFDPIPDGHRVMEFFSFATTPDISPDENTKLTQLSEEFVVELAKQRGYNAIRAENVNVVTQSIAEQLGYVTKCSFTLKDFTRSDGTKPFYDKASQDIFIKGMTKIF